jgi:hypothetical protein
MALLAGSLVLSYNAREIERSATNLERILSASMTGYRPLHDLQRDLQRAAVNQGLESALVVDARGVVLVASNNALVNLPLPHVLQLPYQPRERLPLSLAACDMAAIGLMVGAEDTVAPCKF